MIDFTYRAFRLIMLKLLQSNTLRHRVAQSIIWATAIPFSSRVLSLIRTTILARILKPVDFGVFGLSFTVITLFDTFTSPGLQDAIIQKKDETNRHLDAVWTFHVFRGLLLAVLLLVLFPLFSQYFKEPILANILPFLSLFFILKGISNIGIIYFQKNLEFHKRFIYVNIGVVSDIIVSIILAMTLKNFWALVWSCIASEFIMMIFSYILSSYRPRIIIDKVILKELFKFGIWIWGLGMISFFIFRADKFIIAKLLGSSALGFYIMATRFADITAINIGRVFSTVMFPTYSKIQDDLSRLKKGFLINFEIILFITLPITIILVILAPEIIKFMLGEKWLPSARPLQILAIASLLRALMTPCSSMLKGIGKPYIEFILTSIRAGITFSTALVFTKLWEISGTAFAILLGVVITYPIWIYLGVKFVNLKLKEIFTEINPMILGAGLMTFAIILSKYQFPLNFSPTLIVVAIFAIILFILPSVYFWRVLKTGPFFVITNYFRGK